MLYLGLAQSLISTVFFLFRKPRHISNEILSGWFFTITLFFLGLLLPKGLTYYIKIGFVPFLGLSGPIFYFYVKSMVEPHFAFKKKDVFHLLPFLLLSIVRVIVLPESVTTNLYVQEGYQFIFLFIIILIGSATLIYWLATFRLVLQHQKNVLDFFSNRPEEKSLKWVIPFMFCVLLSNLLFFLTPRLNVFFTSIDSSTFWLQHFNFAMMGYFLLYFGINQPVIFDTLQQKQAEQTNEKYAKSGLNQQLLEKYALQIKRHFEAVKPFTNPEYNLQLLANELGISRQNLSQTINKIYQKNFYQLVNEYRVEEFKKLSIDSQNAHLTLFGVAIEAGFNSKSSFNRIFKEVTGQTPSQYIKGKRS